MLLNSFRTYASNALRHCSSALYVTSLGLTRLASFVFALVAIKAFSIDSYAIYVKIFSVQLLIQSIAGSGINELLIPIIHNSGHSGRQDKLDIAREHLFPMASLLLICLSIACPLLLASVANNRLFAIASVSYVMYGISFFLLNSESSYLNLTLLRSKASLFNLTNGIIVPGGALLLSSWYDNPLLYPSALFFLSLLSILLLSSPYLHKDTPLTPSSFKITNSYTTKIFSYSLIGSIASWASGFGILYLASFLYQPTELQVYSTIFSLSSIPGVVSTLLNQAWTPYFYGSFHSDRIKESLKISNAFYAYLSIAIISIIVIMTASLHSTLQFLLGTKPDDNSFSFAIHSLILLSVSYLASVGWYSSQNYFYLFSRIKSLSSIQVVSSLAPFLLVITGKSSVYLPSVIFFCQALLRSITATYLNRRVVPFTPQLLATITPSVMLLSFLFSASPFIEYLYGK